MKKNITKALSVLLGTAVITGGIGAAAYAANSGEPTGTVKVGRALSASKDSDSTVKKDETVYVIASSDGTVKKIIVSDWIKNSAGMTEISDRSELDNIENVKGDEKYTPGGDNVEVWDAEGNDIYYQGSILTLKNGAPALTDGITKLRDGSLALSVGIKEFNEKGVQKLIDAVDGDIAGLVDRINATVEAARSCNNFSGIADGTDGEVKFIYRTDSVESGNK